MFLRAPAKEYAVITAASCGFARETRDVKKLEAMDRLDGICVRVRPLGIGEPGRPE